MLDAMAYDCEIGRFIGIWDRASIELRTFSKCTDIFSIVLSIAPLAMSSPYNCFANCESSSRFSNDPDPHPTSKTVSCGIELQQVMMLPALSNAPRCRHRSSASFLSL